MRDYDRNKESLQLMHWDANNLYERAIPKRLPADCFKRINNVSNFNEGLCVKSV